ncbi:hypothetical protein DXV75_13905 [Alteromonas aestuariivivens]|uniref:DUF4156 domain-containing protein n=1 Tax=Alteromonas aestuariivivens TaxID=1938339 RepID=A0A3D8M5S6_9ALTE|nr:hypothetical protein [Alteromonas aestuariivivens]RDV24512.1 hypothetical protein DXV75_13905 [Alteromonas aestuariivivens]
MTKVTRRFVVLCSIILLSGCASHDLMLAGCDFVTGTYESKIRSQNRHSSNLNYDDDGNEIHVVNGLLVVASGALTRAIAQKDDHYLKAKEYQGCN